MREQVAQLTGRRFLDEYTSDEQQYQALMNAGVAYAQAHDLRPGIALSAEQMAALTTDMVWLVAQTVTLPDGSTTTALVPRLLLKPCLPSGTTRIPERTDPPTQRLLWAMKQMTFERSEQVHRSCP